MGAAANDDLAAAGESGVIVVLAILEADNLREAYRGRVLEIDGDVITVDDDHHH